MWPMSSQSHKKRESKLHPRTVHKNKVSEKTCCWWFLWKQNSLPQLRFSSPCTPPLIKLPCFCPFTLFFLFGRMSFVKHCTLHFVTVWLTWNEIYQCTLTLYFIKLNQLFINSCPISSVITLYCCFSVYISTVYLFFSL